MAMLKDSELRPVLTGGERDAQVSTGWIRKISDDLSEEMPSFRVKEYFDTKPEVLDPHGRVVLATNPETEKVIGLLAGEILATGVQAQSILNIKTILISESWHGSGLLNQLYHQLFSKIVKDRGHLPGTIAFKTYNPKSYAVLQSFKSIPGVEIYPRMGCPEQNPALETRVRSVCDLLAPGLQLDIATGVVLKGAVGVNDFYQDFPPSGLDWVDEHFRDNIGPEDRLLCCLFIENEQAESKILSAFRIHHPHRSTERNVDVSEA